jgi:uncharacterized protein (TIGR02246 family)
MTVKRKLVLGIATTLLASMVSVTGQLGAIAQKSDSSSSKYADDEKAIRSQAEQYAKSFAMGDAKTIADQWTKDATFLDLEGHELHGRDEIEKSFNKLFSAGGRQPLQVEVESVRFPAPNVAIEQGITRSLQSPSPDSASRYTVVHVKENGKWLISNATETAYVPKSSAEYLNDLNWLLGDWSAASEKDKLHFRARWVADKHFILCTYHFDGADPDKISDAEIIGWDPVRKEIFSSSFGAGGGFGQAHWVRDGQSWVRQAWAVTPEGAKASAIYRIKSLGKDAFTWQSASRTLDGAAQPDTNEIKVVRDTATK